MNKCKRCNYEWESRKKNPKCCPKCKSYDWNKNLKKNGDLKPRAYTKFIEDIIKSEDKK